MRINANVQVSRLSDEHLLAEHLEIKMVATILKKYECCDLPSQFILGAGHIKFFSDKFEFLYNRYMSLYEECINRGFHVQNYSRYFLTMCGSNRWNDWEPTIMDNKLILNRIINKIKESPKPYFHYKKSIISKDELINQYINLINT